MWTWQSRARRLISTSNRILVRLGTDSYANWSVDVRSVELPQHRAAENSQLAAVGLLTSRQLSFRHKQTKNQEKPRAGTRRHGVRSYSELHRREAAKRRAIAQSAASCWAWCVGGGAAEVACFP